MNNIMWFLMWAKEISLDLDNMANRKKLLGEEPELDQIKQKWSKFCTLIKKAETEGIDKDIMVWSQSQAIVRQFIELAPLVVLTN